MGLATLALPHQLLIALVVAVRRRDPVLVRQVAEKADRELADAVLRRTFSKVTTYNLTPDDLHWLQTCEQ